MNTVSQSSHKGKFFFDPKDRIYKDHFPSNPVVPGSMIIHAFIEAGKSIDLPGTVCGMSNFKFKKFIPPGEYPYRIDIKQNNIKCFLYDDTDTTVATGKLTYET